MRVDLSGGGMNKFELMYGLGKPKPIVLQQTDSDFTLKTPQEILADIHESMRRTAQEVSSVLRHMTIAIPTGKTMRKVHHFKGRRYVTRYSVHDILSGWFK